MGVRHIPILRFGETYSSLDTVEISDVRTGESRAAISMANPELLWVSEEERSQEEGCLSLPEQYAEVERPYSIRVRYLDHSGAEKEMAASGVLATCIQHEMDHLDGILFVDHISSLKRNMILRKLIKAKKLAAA